MANTGRCVSWVLLPLGCKSAMPLREPIFPPNRGILSWEMNDALEELLWEAIRTAEVEERFRAAFHVTEPLWLGLWMDPPLTAEKCSILYEVFSLFLLKDKKKRKDYEIFLEALLKASRGEVQFYASLSPVGHTDFGNFAIYPHCPRCKDTPGIWPPFPDEVTCEVCGNVYSPAATFSQREMYPRHDFSPEEPPLPSRWSQIREIVGKVCWIIILPFIMPFALIWIAVEVHFMAVSSDEITRRNLRIKKRRRT
jgi:hypothetical protein